MHGAFLFLYGNKGRNFLCRCTSNSPSACDRNKESAFHSSVSPNDLNRTWNTSGDALLIGGIKASTGKKAAPHFGFAGYACQIISKTILVLELTVWHNHIISLSICDLLQQGSIQPCAAEHATAWGSVCQWQHTGRERPTLQWGEHHRLPQGLSCRSPRAPQWQRLMQPLSSSTCNWEQHLAFRPQRAAQHLIMAEDRAEQQHAQHF